MPIDVSSHGGRLGKWRFAACVYSDTGVYCADREIATVNNVIYRQNGPAISKNTTEKRSEIKSIGSATITIG